MTQNDIATLHALRLDGRTDVATLLDLLVSRVEELEREVRRQRTIVGGLVEHAQIREERDANGARKRAAGGLLFIGPDMRLTPLVPTEPRD